MKGIIHNKREFNSYIDFMNMKHGFFSAVLLSVCVPLFLLCIHVLNIFNEYITAITISCIVLEAIQLVYLCIFIGSLLTTNKDAYKLVYISYFALTISTLMCCSVFDITDSGSELIYILTCFYFIFVPIFSEKTRLSFIAGETGIMIVLFICVKMDMRNVWDIALIQLTTIIVSGYQQNLMVRKERISDSLKKKTISSERDQLTGLMNRRGLQKRADAIWPFCERHNVPVGIITLDIDYFKKYNDKFGHPQGDECLKIVADALSVSVKRKTDIVTRTGGEEFLIFVQDINHKELVDIALRIRKNIETKAIPHAYCAISKHVTVSMGIASTIPSKDNTFHSLYEEADKALYMAKQNGRNCIVYGSNLYGRIRNGMAQVISM